MSPVKEYITNKEAFVSRVFEGRPQDPTPHFCDSDELLWNIALTSCTCCYLLVLLLLCAISAVGFCKINMVHKCWSQLRYVQVEQTLRSNRRLLLSHVAEPLMLKTHAMQRQPRQNPFGPRHPQQSTIVLPPIQAQKGPTTQTLHHV